MRLHHLEVLLVSHRRERAFVAICHVEFVVVLLFLRVVVRLDLLDLLFVLSLVLVDLVCRVIPQLLVELAALLDHEIILFNLWLWLLH